VPLINDLADIEYVHNFLTYSIAFFLLYVD
jgi:hypothetical protein